MLTKAQKEKARALYEGGANTKQVCSRFSSKGSVRREIRAYLRELRSAVQGKISVAPVRERRGGGRYLLTCAQNNTHIHKPFWTNLQAFAAHIGAQILVSRFSYDTNARMTEHKPGTARPQKIQWYPPEIQDYVSDENMQLAPDLLWAGKMNVLPTAARPLSSLESYVGAGSGIFPHAKHAVDSLPRVHTDPPRFNYTTGAVTQINYIQRKAGQKAEFHHIYGAALVEVEEDGRWWVRHINASSDGSFQDLDRFVAGGRVHTGRRVEAVVYGDLHYDEVDDANMRACWGADGVVDRLHPKQQVFHDVLNMGRRSHHDRDNPSRLFELWRDGKEDVEGEVEMLALFLRTRAEDDGGQVVVVDSNHDRALTRWLKETTPKSDLPNAQYWLALNTAHYQALAEDDRDFHLLEFACRKAGCPDRVRFLREDETYTILDIEHGMHGDRGANGARGSITGFLRMGRRISVGHSHTAQVLDGVFVAGTSSRIKMSYNVGPTGWSHSHIILYPNGKRTLLTTRDGRPWGKP